MNKHFDNRSVPLSEKFRLVSIILFYVSVILIAVAIVMLPILLLVSIFSGVWLYFVSSLYFLVVSLIGFVLTQVVMLVIDAIAIAILKREKELTPEELRHFNNSFSVPEFLSKKYDEFGQKKPKKNPKSKPTPAGSASVPQETPEKPASSEPIEVVPEQEKPIVPPEPGWTCTCGQKNPEDAGTCSHCGSPKPSSLF